MKVCVLGLWHLGSVTAACLASLGHDVVGCDADERAVKALQQGNPPVGEPGLPELIRLQQEAKRLSFTTDLPAALRSAQVVWVTYDTPVDEVDEVAEVDEVGEIERADVESVISAVEQAFPYLDDGTLVLISSQLPVGSTREIERRWALASEGRRVRFACSPENLRLGKALEVFLSPDRIVVGTRDAENAAGADEPGGAALTLNDLFGPLADRIVWMGVESAEMTKHAINAFLATSVGFINEVASLCEVVGADAGEVERGLKSEARIGPRAYLGPGAAFAGGTLARDVQFLRAIGAGHQKATPLFDGLAVSNARHRSWAIDRLECALGSLRGRRIAVWGLTYKAGTTTLRRSDAVVLCRRLVGRGAAVQAHDPTVASRPAELDPAVVIGTDPLEAAVSCDALVVATGWPQYREVPAERLLAALTRPVVVDANRFLDATIGADDRFEYFSVGRHR
jgi:UDPglucose 6-dehydrogenase